MKQQAATVLIISPSPIVRQGLTTILQDCEDMRAVVGSGGGTEALALCRQHRPHVCILDSEFLDASSVDYLAAIHQEVPQSRIFVLTVTERDTRFARAREAGACACLPKGISGRELINRIRAG
ncbi:MAG: response regulator transcription factor [Verrucomicrobiota bacterium]